MISSEIKVLIDRADESHQAAKLLLDKGFSNFFGCPILLHNVLFGRSSVVFKGA
jgi:hypothetical protein